MNEPLLAASRSDWREATQPAVDRGGGRTPGTPASSSGSGSLPGPSARVVNSYGLTEATIDSTYFEGELVHGRSSTVPSPSAARSPGAAGGRPRSGGWSRCPIGADPGELFIGGAGMGARLSRAAGHSPPSDSSPTHSPSPAKRGGRYRTGDLARWRPDGALLNLVGRLRSPGEDSRPSHRARRGRVGPPPPRLGRRGRRDRPGIARRWPEARRRFRRAQGVASGRARRDAARQLSRRSCRNP